MGVVFLRACSGHCHRDILLSQQMLDAIKHVADDIFGLSATDCTGALCSLQRGPIAPSPRIFSTLCYFPDLKLVDYKIYGVTQCNTIQIYIAHKVACESEALYGSEPCYMYCSRQRTVRFSSRTIERSQSTRAPTRCYLSTVSNSGLLSLTKHLSTTPSQPRTLSSPTPLRS